MRILLVHNNYGVYSGEEAVVDQQLRLFQSMNHTVDIFRRDSSKFRNSFIGNIKGLLSGIYSFDSVRSIKILIKTDKPDIVVIHNLYPFISPAILIHIKKAGIPIIMTVHNYRLMCPTGLFMRDLKPCELCVKGSEWNCIRYNCEQSLFRSVGYALRNWYARKTKAFYNNVDMYACITKFQTTKLIQAGFKPERMDVIPNFLDQIPDYERIEGEYVAVSGRLSQEKGIDLILKVAQKTPHIKYVFAGAKRTGDVWKEQVPPNCCFLGYLSKEDLRIFYQKAKFLLVGSLWYEGFPVTVLEASSAGKPTVGPAHAGFLEIIDDGVTGMLFKPGDAIDMEKKVCMLWENTMKSTSMGEKAYMKLKSKYSVEAVFAKWSDLFEKLKSLA